MTLVGVAPDVALQAWFEALDGCNGLAPGAPRDVPLADALGHVLACELRARQASPAYRCAAMDGIAVRAADTAAATASAPQLLPAGAYDPIDTGQAIDPRFDAVVPVEETIPDPEGVRVRRAARCGDHVRAAGEDVAAGAMLVEAGRRLGPADLALAAAGGYRTVPAHPRPQVAILPTGAELRPPGSALAPGQVVESNSIMLGARVRTLGGSAATCPVPPEDTSRLARSIEEACASCQLVLVLAGSSRGRRDHTASALAAAGEVVVRGVSMRPGHPTILAVVAGTPVIGVPGYPVAAAVAFERFGRPVIAACGGAGESERPLAVTLVVGVEADPLAERALLVQVAAGGDGRHYATPLPRRGGLTALARASAVLRLPAGGGAHEPGTPSVVWPLGAAGVAGSLATATDESLATSRR